MNCLEKELDLLVKSGTAEHIAIRVGRGNEVLYDTFRGGVDENTLFDMASVTKIISTTSLALIALDKGLINLDDPVSKFYQTDKPLTIKNLLTHTIGIGFKRLFEGEPYENIAETILNIPSDIPIGSDVRYSCPGYILLGKILGQVFGKRLDECFDEFVAKPLSMNKTSYLPRDRHSAVNANWEEDMRGVVNDRNCRFLGGVAGNAGIFSNLSDLSKYVNCLLNSGKPLISEKTFSMAVQNYTPGMSESRGLGFLYVDGKYKQTGGLFEDGAIGHCGHTGQSIFLDYRTGLYVVILSDASISTVRKYGKENYDEVIDMREKLHAAIKQDLEEK